MIKRNEYYKIRRPNSQKNLTWDFRIYDDWLKEHVYVRYFGNQGKNDWCNMVTKFVDYLANPSIKMKHREVFEFFFNTYFITLDSD